MRPSISGAAFFVTLLWGAGAALAQPVPQPLPPLPPPSAEPSSRQLPQPPSQPPPALPPPPAPSTPAPEGEAPPPAQYTYTPPPRPVGPSGDMSREEITHAPAYSLWLGGSAGLLIYNGGLYQNDVTLPGSSPGTESVGNFVRPGAAFEADVGARLARRYIPYLAVELGVLGAGRRFGGTSTTASSSFIGVGFRYLAGDVDSVSFASDVSMGFRSLQVSNASGTWTTTGFEIFRLGFGADIRLTTHTTLTPMVTVTGGTFTDTSGNITFAANQADGKMNPDFTGRSGIPSANQDTYWALVIGCGVHFDLLGR